METSVRRAESAILFQTRWKDEIHANISRRILQKTSMLPVPALFTRHLRNGTSLHPLSDRHLEYAQVTRYTPRGHYVWHRDGTPAACDATFSWTECRAYTAIVYLNTVKAKDGGATAITFADGSEVRVQPSLGLGFFFVSEMRHTGEELHAGEKFILNQWIRFRPLPLLFYDGGSLIKGVEALAGMPALGIFAAAERVGRRLSPAHSVIVTIVGLSVCGACLCSILIALIVRGCRRIARMWRGTASGTASVGREQAVAETVALVADE